MPELLCPVLVGRDREVEELRSALDRAAAGHGATLAVVGEAGVGKSRLVREAAADAVSRRVPVLTGRAVERDNPQAFRPLAEALFSHLRRSGPPNVPALAPFRPILGRLIPEWRLPGERPAEESLVVLGEAVLRVLAEAAEGTGCVLVLEDLHWADSATLEVVEYLADNVADQPILCLMSLRDEEPSLALSRVHSLAARRSASVLRLQRLTADEVDAVAAACLRSEAVPVALAEVLAIRADGLPFLVEELVAAMVQDGELRQTTEGWVLDHLRGAAIPVTFADTVRRRLEATPGTRELLGAAALLGRSFDWRLLPDMIKGQDEASVAKHLRGAAAVQLLSVEPTGGGSRFRFRHALTREAILAELSPPEHVVLASSGLRAVEQAHPGLPGEWCELAAELAEAAGQPARAAELLLESARRAFARGALASAEVTLERARDLVGDDAQCSAEIDEVLCELLLATGSAQRVSEVGQRLLTSLGAVAAPPGRRARAHLLLARAAIVSADWARARDHLHLAEELSESGGVAGESEVLAARVALGEGQLDDAATLARTALATAQKDGRYELACEALEVLGQRERQHDLAAAEDAFSAALVLADQHRLPLWRIRALHELGTIDLIGGGPLDRLAQARQAALDAGALATAATVSLQMAAWSTNHAEPEGGIKAARSCATEAGRLRLPLVAGVGYVLQAVCHALLDQHAEMEVAIDKAVTVSGGHREVRGDAALMARALLWLVREDRRRALVELDAGMELLRDTPVTAPNRGLWALLHALDGDDGPAAVAEVEASGLTVYWLIRGWVGHARAVELGRRGHIAEAEEVFARADADLAPCDWYRHHARRLVAEAAIRDRWGNPTRWLAEALAFFDATGPPAVASACRSLLRQAGVPVPRRRRPAPDLPGALANAGVTPREAEVLTLLAEGLSTRDIAARLYLSPKTAERHIANLVTKLAVESRSELVSLAARHLLGVR
jgi:DNA-binding NarL/FixJ family response regulator